MQTRSRAETLKEDAADPECNVAASLWSPVDPKCIQLKPTPALTALLRAAFSNLLANVTSATVEGALEATGNAALIQLATTSAFTPEQLKIMENMSASDNAEMKEAVEKIQSRLSNAVAEGIETARKTVVPPLEKATGEIVNGMIVSFLNAVSDIPGVGFVLSALGLINTVVKAASSADQIVEKAKEAAEPVTDAIGNLQQTVGKLASKATVVAPQSVAPPNVNVVPQSVAPPNEATVVVPPSVTPPSVNVAPPSEATVVTPPSEATVVVPPSVNVAPPSVNVAPPSVNVAPPSEATVVAPQSVTPRSVPQMKTGRTVRHGGGSRKRRRIHKLSRRIERTLRRVQKKYGFKDKGDKGDKGDFLRRTLKHHKHKR